MKSLPKNIAVFTLLSSLTLTSCETMSPLASAGIAGGLAGVGSGAIARHAGVSSTGSALIGTAVGVTTAAIVYSYQKRKATEREQALAKARAEKYQKKVKAKSKAKPKTRYVAVPVEESDTVMLYDTKKDKLVNSSAYELEKTPKKGEVVKFGSVNAEYVGI
jgi:heme/copper-type cytochrome/quinol oxidase subunit 1